MSDVDDGSKSEDDEGGEDSAETSKPKAPKIGAPKSEDSSPFDTGWDAVLSSKPSAPVFTPPSAMSAKSPSKPRTSDEESAVSGEVGSLDATKDTKDADAKGADAKDEDAKGEDEQGEGEDEQGEDAQGEGEDEQGEDAKGEDEQGEDENDEDEKDEKNDEDDEEADGDKDKVSRASKKSAASDKDRAKPAVASAEKNQQQGGSRGLLTIFAVVAAMVLLFIYVNNQGGDEGEAGHGPSKPNVGKQPAAKGGPSPPGPAPRPPEVKTRAADSVAETVPHETAEVSEGETGEGETGEGETGAGETGEGEAGEGETGAVEATEPEPTEPEPTRPHVDDPRDPSLIPPGTPAENAKAFAKLPASIHDGPPIGGIGSNGIHVDEIAMSRGRDNADCTDPSRSFSVSDTEFINVCFRAVHPRSQDNLRVIWEKDGTVARRGKLRIPENLHAYKTRAYLQVRPEYVGSWRVRIVPEGEEDIDLAVAKFEISG